MTDREALEQIKQYLDDPYGDESGDLLYNIEKVIEEVFNGSTEQS